MRIALYVQLLVILSIFSIFVGVTLANKYPRIIVETRYITVERAVPTLPDYAGGILYRGDEYDTILCRTEEACLHEVGHILFFEEIDAVQWEKDVSVYIATGVSGRLCELSLTFANFPGICGNELILHEDGGTWGGYVELYAEMYRELHKYGEGWREKPPEELMEYFEFRRRNMDE